MKTKQLISWLRHGAVCAFALTAAVATADDSSLARLVLQNTGVETNAAGSVLSQLNPKSSLFSVSARKLTPGHSYTLTVGDLPEATFTANTNGRALLTFVTPPRKNQLLLDFDPRGQLVAIRDGTNSVLEAVVSGANEPSGIIVDERATLARLAGIGEARARYYSLPSGKRIFIVRMERVTGTNWSLFVNGISRGGIDVRGREAAVIFDSNPTLPGRRLLDFDPRGQVIDIAQGTNLMFSGKLEAKAKNVNVATPSMQIASIPSTGVDADGTARARLRVESDARRKFSVEVENVPVGAYEFLVNGVLEGTINVVTSVSGSEGEIEFSSREDNGDELPLLFNPTNSTFIVQQYGVIFFEGPVSFNAPGGTSSNAPTLLDERLASTHLDADASGHAKFEIDDRGRRKFSVEIEDVAVGSYELWVGGVQRGTIAVALRSTKVKGQLEFASPTDDPGKGPLNFDPRGQLVEVKTGAGVFFSHLFGVDSAAGGTTSFVMPARLEVPLFNLGVTTNASAKAKFTRDDRGRRNFEVEIEDAPAGDYALFVGDTQVGIVSVISSPDGTRGQVEFEDGNGGGHLPLTFDPLGQLITLSREGTNYFQRVFPRSN